MADAVSKLYAELGFKVNQDGLKQVQAILKDFAVKMGAVNKATKEAAREYGIFSKEKSKQALADEKLATQQARTEEVRTRSGIKLRNQAFKESMAIKKAEFSEKIKQERENERLARNEQIRNEKSLRERKRLLNEALASTRQFARGIGGYLKAGALGFGRVLYSGVQQSLSRSIATRDFMLATGANLGDIQSVVERFANIGESVSQEQIMGDLIKLSQGIAEIALGQGDADTYKLLGQAAERGDISGMLKGFKRAGSYIDNDLFMKLLGSAGLPSYWLSFFKAQGAGVNIGNFIDQEGQGKIETAKSHLELLGVSFKNLADWLTATLSPTIVEVTTAFRQWNEEMTESLKGEGGEKLSNLIRRLSGDLMKFLKALSPDTVYSSIVNFLGALEYLAQGIVKIAKFFGYSTPKDEEDERLKKLWFNDMVMSGASFSDILREQHRIPSSGISIVDQRHITNTVNVKDEEVVGAVQDTMIKFGGLNIDSASIGLLTAGRSRGEYNG